MKGTVLVPLMANPLPTVPLDWSSLRGIRLWNLWNQI